MFIKVFVIVPVALSCLCTTNTVVAKGQSRNVLVLLGKCTSDVCCALIDGFTSRVTLRDLE